MGSPSASTGGGRTDGGQMNSTTATKIGVGNIDEKGRRTSPQAFRNRGAEDIKKKSKTPMLAILSKPLQAGSKVTRDFFTDKVLGSKNYRGTTKKDFDSMTARQQEEIYGKYISSRTAGETDAYGRKVTDTGSDNRQSDNNSILTKSDQPVVKGLTPVTAPSETETKVAEEKKEYDARQTKKKGKRKNILTSSQGVMKTSADYSLGETSLLGRVV